VVFVCHCVHQMFDHRKFDYLIGCGNIFFYCSRVLLIAAVVGGRFKKSGSFVRKLWILGLALKNKSSHRPVLNTSKFCINVEIPQIRSRFCSPWSLVIVNH